MTATARRPGARWLGEGRSAFEVWAPRAERVEVVAERRGGDPDDTHPLAADADGYHHGTIAGLEPGDTYRVRLHRPDGTFVDRADPASRWQPQGLHGPSAVDDPTSFDWTDRGFSTPPLHEQVLYELHVGTFSPPGTFDGVIAQLPHLVALGVTAIELLPVAQFPGERNWGYDGVLLYAVQDSYGGPDGLRRLVDAAHAHGIGVVLDVVYNHVGPEGNHLDDFGPYFTDRYDTPWGPALNTDGPGADAVRRFVVEHAVGFARDFHLDGFRLDAVHSIFDQSAVHLVEELTAAVHADADRRGRRVHVIAESDLNDPRLVRPPQAGGYGLDAQWADEFHHAIHVTLTGERDGYYADHVGLEDVARQVRDRYVYAGRHSPARGRRVGRPARDVPYDRFVACVQNHDQVGNRMLGERLGQLVDFESTKLAAAALLTAPFVPMLFMGEEYGEVAPFQYFVSHSEPDLVEAVRTGRREEFAGFAWQGEAPDPQDPATFQRSRVDITRADHPGPHATLFGLYQQLIGLRREVSVLSDPDAPDVTATLVPGHEAIVLRREHGDEGAIVVINAELTEVGVDVPAVAGTWALRLATADHAFGGPGRAGEPGIGDDAVLRLPVAPRSVAVLVRSRPDANRTTENV